MGKKGFFMGEKGFVITIDAFLGITLMFALIIVAFFFFSQTELSAWNSVDLRNAVNDEAAVLLKGRILENALQQGSSELVLMNLNSSSDNYCFEVTITGAGSSSIVLHSIKTGCVKSSDNIAAVNKSVVVRSNSLVSFYIARVEGWVK